MSTFFFFFFFIRNSFNRFSPVDLRSQEEIQDRKIRPALSFGFAETGYIHPINSRPCAPLDFQKSEQKPRSEKSLLKSATRPTTLKLVLKTSAFPLWPLAPPPAVALPRRPRGPPRSRLRARLGGARPSLHEPPPARPSPRGLPCQGQGHPSLSPALGLWREDPASAGPAPAPRASGSPVPRGPLPDQSLGEVGIPSSSS